MNLNKSLDERMQDHETCIKNSISDPEICEEVSVYGYTQEKLEEGDRLFEETKRLVEEQGSEYAEQKHASAEFSDKRILIHKQFVKDRKLARVALRNNLQLLQVNLGVNGKLSELYAKWLSQVEQFYGNAIKKDEIMVPFAELSMTPAYLKAALANIAELKSLRLTQKKEMGDAQVATMQRDVKLDELDEWVADYKVVAGIAFEDNPQVLEKLGILVRS